MGGRDDGRASTRARCTGPCSRLVAPCARCTGPCSTAPCTGACSRLVAPVLARTGARDDERASACARRTESSALQARLQFTAAGYATAHGAARESRTAAPVQTLPLLVAHRRVKRPRRRTRWTHRHATSTLDSEMRSLLAANGAWLTLAALLLLATPARPWQRTGAARGPRGLAAPPAAAAPPSTSRRDAPRLYGAVKPGCDGDLNNGSITPMIHACLHRQENRYEVVVKLAREPSGDAETPSTTRLRGISARRPRRRRDSSPRRRRDSPPRDVSTRPVGDRGFPARRRARRDSGSSSTS